LLPVVALALYAAGCHSSEGPKSPGDATIGNDDGGGSGSKGRGGTKAVGNPSGPSVVNFPGFEVTGDGRSIVTVQVRGPVQVGEQKAEGRIVYVLSGVAVPERVNRLPLVTSHFPTQVTSVTVEQTPGGANLLIDLREPSAATFKVTQNEAGILLTISLPRSERWGVKNPSRTRRATRSPSMSWIKPRAKARPRTISGRPNDAARNRSARESPT